MGELMKWKEMFACKARMTLGWEEDFVSRGGAKGVRK